MRLVGACMAVSLALLAGLTAQGCGWLDTADDCALDPILHCGPFAGGTGVHDGGTDGADDDGGTDGADGSAPDCSGDPTQDPAIVSDECGVFVSANAADGGDGKEATPFQTFAEAAAVKPSRIFACAGMYTESAQVSFTGGVDVYGGFTGCTATSWTWSSSMQARSRRRPT